MPQPNNDAAETVDSPINLFEIPAEDAINDEETAVDESVEETEDAGPQTKTEDVPNKQKPDRFEYWQSEATKLKNELEKLQSYAPIVRYMESNPQVIDVLTEQLIKGTQTANQAPVQEELKAPVKPAMPQNYDPLDTDPKSESAKYREALDKYYDEKDAYLEKKMEMKLKPVEETLAQQKAREAELQQIKEAQLGLMQSRGWDAQKALNFIQFARDPQSYQDLPEYFEWKMAKAKANPNPPAQKKASAPTPVGASSGKSDPPKSGSTAFIDSLNAGRKSLFTTVNR